MLELAHYGGCEAVPRGLVFQAQTFVSLNSRLESNEEEGCCAAGSLRCCLAIRLLRDSGLGLGVWGLRFGGLRYLFWSFEVWGSGFWDLGFEVLV